MVTSSIVTGYGYRASNVKAKSVSTLTLFPKAMKYFVTTFYRHSTGRNSVGTVKAGVVPYLCLKSQALTPWLLTTRIERSQPLACFDDFHPGVLSGARCKLEGKQRVTFVWKPVKEKQRQINDPWALG